MSVLLGRGGPEEVLLQGWGYGRSRTDPSHQGWDGLPHSFSMVCNTGSCSPIL